MLIEKLQKKEPKSSNKQELRPLFSNLLYEAPALEKAVALAASPLDI